MSKTYVHKPVLHQKIKLFRHAEQTMAKLEWKQLQNRKKKNTAAGSSYIKQGDFWWSPSRNHRSQVSQETKPADIAAAQEHENVCVCAWSYD